MLETSKHLGHLQLQVGSRNALITLPVYWGGPCSGRWFLVRFSDLILGSQDNGFIQERGVVAGTRVGVVILVPVFLGALVAVFLVVLVFFGRYLGCNSVAIPCLDKGWILAWSFGCLFLLLFWLDLSLLSWSLFFSLLLCSWVPGTRVGSLHGRFSSC